MFRIVTAFLIMLSCAAWIGPSAIAQRPGSIQLDVDYSSFAYSEEESLVEIYLAFEAATLAYLSTDSGFLADLPVGLSVYRSSQAQLEGTPVEPIWSDSLHLDFVMADTTGLVEGQHFIHQIRAVVPPGEYELRLGITERSSTGRMPLELRRDLLIPDYSNAAAVSVSDVTLASVIQGSDVRDDLFYKNGLIIRPNANQLFGYGLNTLFYYTEVYGLSAAVSPSGKYSVFSYISEANTPRPIQNLQNRKTRDVRDPDVLIGSFDVSQLASGSYFLRIAVLDEGNQSVAEQSKKFFVYNPLVEREAVAIVNDQTFENSRYAAMTDDEVELELKLIEMMETPSERRRAKSITDPEEKRRAIMDFWLVRDPSPSSPINEYEENFRARVQYANDRYTTAFDEGWNTDRGRTLIRFGTPSNIDPHLYDREVNPYETWEYNNIPGEGRAIFVFGDTNNTGRFELLHSTVTGERNNPTWMRDLRN